MDSFDPNTNRSNATTEPKGRMRVSKACDRCRTQKIKCSGTYPCTTCTKHKRECIYSSNQIKPKDNETSPPTILNIKNEHGLPYIVRNEDKSYIKHLENRIQYLESRLSNEGDKLVQYLDNGETEDESTRRFINPTSKWRYSNRNQMLLISELCKTSYGYLNDENKKKIILPRHQYFGWNMSGTHYLSPEPLPEFPNIKLDHDIKWYIDYFFKEINPLFAIIHEQVFRLQLESYLSLSKNKNGLESNETKLFEAMLYLVITLVIRFTEFQKRKDFKLENLTIEEQLFKYCYKIVSILSFEWESFELIQCWIFITLYLRITHRQNSYYQSLGYAITMTKSMGLSRKGCNHRLPGTPYESLKAKRIFWTVYIFERLFGLQSGRYGLISQDEIELEFPGYDFNTEREKDSWITLPALALIHIAKLATVVHSADREKLDILKYQQINKEIIFLNSWLNEHGFNNNEIFNNPNEKLSSLVKSQVKFHYYDLIISIHGKVLFNFVGRRIATQGFKIELVLDSSIDIVEIFMKINKAGLLYSPWYFGLLLLFNVGINFLVLINAGLFLPTAREYYSKTMNLITILKKANVKSNDNKILIKKRFKMAEECLWALKTAGKILSLRFEQDLQVLDNIGIDPGNHEVNKQTFTQYGLANKRQGGELKEFTELIRNGKRIKTENDVGSDDHNSPPTDLNLNNLTSNVANKLNNYNEAGAKQSSEEINRDKILSYSNFPEDNIDYAKDTDNSTENTENNILELERLEKEKTGKQMYSNLTWFDQWLNIDFDNQLFNEINNQSDEPIEDHGPLAYPQENDSSNQGDFRYNY